MWLWILLITALIAAAFIFTVSWMLVKLVITPERSSLEEVEQLEIERGNFAPGARFLGAARIGIEIRPNIYAARL